MSQKSFPVIFTLIIVVFVIALGAVLSYRFIVGEGKEETGPAEDEKAVLTPQDKALEARIISAMNQLRTAAAIAYANDNSYENLSCSHSAVAALCRAQSLPVDGRSGR